MIDLRVRARGMEFDCLGLAECAAESVGARCPCARRCTSPAKVAATTDVSHETARPTPNPPVPKLGEVLIDAMRRRLNGAA